ncbi:MAG: lipoprotein insertase outer membrane protein LolB [Dokdonella sp.]
MSRRILRGATWLALVLALTACAGQHVKHSPPDADALSRQVVREQALAAQSAWTLRGRLGVSDGHDGGSGSLEWSQHDRQFRFSVHAPVTGKTWTLSGGPGHVVLEGLRDAAIAGDDASALLERELGWRVPVAELVAWARGARASGVAQIEFRADGLPAQIDQAGWKVQFLDYDPAHDPPLPSKIFAAKGSYKVRLSIREWTLE